MNRYIFLISMSVLFSSVAIAGDLVFKKMEHDFKKLEHKSHTVATFHYQNTSDTPIVIVYTKHACNCTKVAYSKKPILAGESGTLTITFSAKSLGVFFKSVDIVTQKGTERLTLRGVVIK